MKSEIEYKKTRLVMEACNLCRVREYKPKVVSPGQTRQSLVWFNKDFASHNIIFCIYDY